MIIDVQEKLMPAVLEADRVIANTLKLNHSANRLGVPILVTEQYPAGLGKTVPPLFEVIGNETAVMEKTFFSAMKDKAIYDHVGELRQAGREQIILAGAEAHVCVLQTAIDLASEEYDVFVVADAVASRVEHSLTLGLNRMMAAGVEIINTEMVLFEWIENSDTTAFRDLRELL